VIWAGVSTAAYAALREDDAKLANIAAAVSAAGLITGGVWWAWYQTSHGPLPGREDLPGPLPGTADDVVTQLDPGDGYRVARPAKAFGRERTITGILDGIGRYHDCAGPDAPDLVVGNISKMGGGPMPPHASHRTGRDVDIALPETAHQRWCLLRAFIADPKMQYVFYDRVLIGKAAAHAAAMGGADAELAELELGPKKRVRHSKGHRDHVHVRFQDE
jgi:hypothetical protein